RFSPEPPFQRLLLWFKVTMKVLEGESARGENLLPKVSPLAMSFFKIKMLYPCARSPREMRAASGLTKVDKSLNKNLTD
ncbi:hypothetical protein, partial [Megalodesulfovibrio gigas]|uniref:hypothetical protein n=1 Tax=Megalodesulfovibrio gigas TaxID=879 RepID=UPI00054F10C7